MRKQGMKCVGCRDFVTLDYCYDYDLCLDCGPMRPKEDKVDVDSEFYQKLRKKHEQ